ncbi:hypothetical protein [Streptomyces mirabilis]|uniref:hypothetical protein n=1 Tax=Streptomyces mirabilis TaxID=68239 RepID=UPI00331F2A0D
MTSSYAIRRPSGGRGGPRRLNEAQIGRLKAQNPDLQDRVTDRDATIGELAEFKKLALSRLAAQHDEIMPLRSPQSSLEPAPPAEPAPVPRARTTVYGNRS